jgi:hypothetical protein
MTETNAPTSPRIRERLIALARQIPGLDGDDAVDLISRPRWDESQPWALCVREEIRALWECLPLEAKLVAVIHAAKMADERSDLLDLWLG